jgi:hypothetical protein
MALHRGEIVTLDKLHDWNGCSITELIQAQLVAPMLGEEHSTHLPSHRRFSSLRQPRAPQEPDQLRTDCHDQ